MIEKARYVYERLYPYIFSLIICLVAYFVGFLDENQANLNDALGAVITVASLIIGFVGAVLPIIMGMKGESEYIRNLFLSDEEQLFTKYIRATVGSGLMAISMSFVLYFDSNLKYYKIYIMYLWLYMLVTFLLSTYRCTSIILKLIFSNTPERNDFYEKNSFKSQHEIDIENENSIEKK